MMEIDRQAIVGRGIPGVLLMENAGRACCQQFIQKFSRSFPGPVFVLAGKGNNGGDGYVMGRVLSDLGWQVRTLVLADEGTITGDAGVMLKIMRKLGLAISFVSNSEQLKQEFSETPPQVIIDAIFGTGLNSEVRGLQAAAIGMINDSSAAVFSVDIPSGVDGSNGRVCGLAVQADLTVTFDQAKIGHASQPGAGCAGQLEVVDIGIPRIGRQELPSQVQLLDMISARTLLPERSAVGHKGKFGHLLVLAGSPGKTGAAALAGNAAARSGCGLVTVGTPAAVHDIMEVKLTEAMSYPLADRDGSLSIDSLASLNQLLVDREALAIGPGLGVTDDLAVIINKLVTSSQLPLVIDADGINLLAGQIDCLQAAQHRNIILTPHPGELARLTGLTVGEIEADRFEIAKQFASQHAVVLLLKGSRTVIAAPDGRVNINSSGNDGLSSGGSGDVLTGLIGGLLAQGLDAFSAASLGAWLHGRAAELVAELNGTAGMTASDLLPQLPVARQELVKGARVC
jgi:NAD(P)H-hydrate epimerase